jgi:hypothetical protein
MAVTVLMAVFGTTAHADTVYGYAGPGAWFSPGDGYGSSYDTLCYPWIDNNFAKSSSSWGLVTFIDQSGGWSYSKQAYGNIFRELPASAWGYKKLHCKNTSSARYQGGCFGFRRYSTCA